MRLDRKAGRMVGDGIGFPKRCSALIADPLARCTAEFTGRRCLLCTRVGDWPLPAEIDDIGYNVIATRTVQIIRATSAPEGYLVAVFVAGRLVDGRYPIIHCRTKAGAVELAHARARQIEPTASLTKFRDERDAWKCGSVLILVAAPAA